MQRWTTIALLGVTLAGCQVAAGSSDTAGTEASAAVSQAEETCGPIDLSNVSPYVPKAVKYNGKPLTPSEPDSVWIILPTDANGVTEAARVNMNKQEVVDVYDITSNALMGQFMAFVLKDYYGQAIFTGHPNPPPPVTDAVYWYVFGQNAYKANARAREQLGSQQNTK